MKLNRNRNNKWILQKNVSSVELINAFVDILNSQYVIDKKEIKECLYTKDLYHGRSTHGSISTMGVRISQACFYMFGYKREEAFMLSPQTELLLRGDIDIRRMYLINLFSMQYPNPYSNTSKNFCIYIGRLILKLLLDERIEKKLYIDECIYYLPFIETIDKDSYNELIENILIFRTLNYKDKKKLLMQDDGYEDLYANCTHEINYYFLRIFNSAGVLDLVGDSKHNDGNLFKFKHGKKGNTFRTDAYKSRKRFSGYVQINSNCINDCEKLINNFTAFEQPGKESDYLSRFDWLREIYELNPINYISALGGFSEAKQSVLNDISEMLYNSKYGSKDGKSFEQKLKPVFELFRENRNVEIISGSGNTDLLCVMEDADENLYKVNVEAKTTRNILSSINPVRLTNHLSKHGSKYCLVVSPRFSRGVSSDIKNFSIATIEAEVLANYCMKEYIYSKDGLVDYSCIDRIIKHSTGRNISKDVEKIIENKYKL